MKKMRLLLVSAALLLALTACGDEPATAHTYKNGTYQARWDGGPEGYADYLKVEIKDDVITVAEFDGVNEEGALKSADSALAAAMRQASSPNLPQAMDPKKAYTMTVEAFNEAEGDPDEMELVAGATETSDSFGVLLQAVLEENAIQGLAEELVLPYYADGSYTAQTAADAEGTRSVLAIEVQGGKPRVTTFGTLQETEGAESAVQAGDAEKATAELLNTALQDGYLTDEDFAEAETAPDALALQLCRTALEAAHLRGAETNTLPALQDGIYKAEMSEAVNGWKDYLVVGVSRGRVQVVEFDAKNEKGSRKSADGEFAAALEAAPADKLHPDSAPAQYQQEIVEAFCAAGGDADAVSEMENVAGATVSTNHFRLMMGELLGYSVPAGETTLLPVAPYTEEAK